MININTNEEYENYLKSNEAVLFYLSTPQCNVCKVLKPKLIEFINQKFPMIKMGYINTEALPEVSAQNSIFTVPTILVFFDRKEFIRKSRNINLTEFENEIERPYSMFFGS